MFAPPPRGVSGQPSLLGSGRGCGQQRLTSALAQGSLARRQCPHKQGWILTGGPDRPQDFSYDEPKVEFDVDAPSGVVMEGYLFKRASNAFKTWNR